VRIQTIFAAASAALAISAAAAAPSQAAVTYDAVAGFNTTNVASASNPWTYGYGNALANGFTAFSTLTSNAAPCFAGVSCWQSPAATSLSVPTVAFNNGSNGDPAVYATVTQPADLLNLHPGDGSPSQEDSIVRFNGPAGTYKFTSLFRLIDSSPSGVIVRAGKGAVVQSFALSGAQGTQTTFSGTFTLGANDYFDFSVNNAGFYGNDSTGFAATITAVPEPATWGLMIVGFAGMGSALRNSRRRATFAA
jgi:hypothetical protein